jgi:hypothetical protein
MATLATRINDLAIAVRNKFNAISARIDAIPGATAPVKLASDFVNATVTFTDITGFSYTPPANSDFEVEAWLLIVAGAAATNLPRLGISVGAGQQYGACSIEQAGASASTEVAMHGTFLTSAVNALVPAGGVAAINTPYEAVVRIKGRSGASPGAIKLQIAAESAAANAAIVKAGSKMVTRTI